jgi:hypothetical protein
MKWLTRLLRRFKKEPPLPPPALSGPGLIITEHYDEKRHTEMFVDQENKFWN